MAFVLLKTPRTSQPQDLAGVDYGNPLARDMKMLLVQQGGKVVDVVNPGVVWTPNGGATVKTTSGGRVASFDGADDYFSATGYENITGRVGTFFIFAPRIGAGDTNGTVWFGSNTGASSYFQSAASGNDYSFAAQITTFGNPFNTTNTSLVFTGNGATTASYKNGTIVGTGATAGTAFAAGSKTFNLGRWIAGAAWDANADFAVVGFTSTPWTAEQVKSFAANPWQLFEPHETYLWFADAVAAAARRRIVLWG